MWLSSYVPEEGDELEVYVTHIESPSMFYCQLASTAAQLPLFVDRLVDFYNSTPQPTLCSPRIGDMCVVHCDDLWDRAVVLSEGPEEYSTENSSSASSNKSDVIDDVAKDQDGGVGSDVIGQGGVTQSADVIDVAFNDTVDVFYVDYGTTDYVLRENIKEIADEFLDGPTFVLECCLADIAPLSGGTEWDGASEARFSELCESALGLDNKLFKAHVCKVLPSVDDIQPLISIRLKDGEMDIGQQLVEGGYALYKANSPNAKSEAHRTYAQVLIEGRPHEQVEESNDENVQIEGDSTLESVDEETDEIMEQYVRNLVHTAIRVGHEMYMAASGVDFKETETVDPRSLSGEMKTSPSVLGRPSLDYDTQESDEFENDVHNETDDYVIGEHVTSRTFDDLATSLQELSIDMTTTQKENGLLSPKQDTSEMVKEFVMPKDDNENIVTKNSALGDTVHARCQHIISPTNFKLIFADGRTQECKLADVEPVDGITWFPDACKTFQEMVYDKELRVCFVTSSDSCDVAEVYIYDVTDDSQQLTVNRLLVDKELARCTDILALYNGHTEQEECSFLNLSEQRSDSLGSLDENGLNDTDDLDSQFSHYNWRVGDSIELRFIDCTREFFICQPVQSEDQFHTLQTDMARRYASGDVPVLEDPFVGQPCVSKWLDNSWQRCEVLEVQASNKIRVRTVDMGDELTVKQVRLLYPEFLALPIQALNVYLDGCADLGDKKTCNDIYNLLDEKHSGESGFVKLNAQVTETRADHCVVAHIHTSDGTHLVEELAELVKLDSQTQINKSYHSSTSDTEEKACCSQLPQLDLTVDVEPQLVVLTHAESPHSLWCQLQQHRDFLDQLQDLYSGVACPPVFGNLQEGDLCVVQMDGKWYRGQVTSEFDGVYVVHCVDVGINITTSVVYPLFEGFGIVPPQAVKCAIAHVYPREGGEWSEEVEAQLSEYVGKEFYMEVNQINEDSTTQVQLKFRETFESFAEHLLENKIVRDYE